MKGTQGCGRQGQVTLRIHYACRQGRGCSGVQGRGGSQWGGYAGQGWLWWEFNVKRAVLAGVYFVGAVVKGAVLAG